MRTIALLTQLDKHTYIDDEFELVGEQASAKVSPWGASITALNIENREVISHVTKTAVDQAFAGVTLAPWPNRLAAGSWVSDGNILSAKLNDPLGNANHGLVFDRKFEIKNRTNDSVTFALELGADLVYPFKVELLVTYSLVGHGLVTEISARNLDIKAAPIAFGSHPYLKVEKNSKVEIACETQMVNDAASIPTGEEPASKNKSVNHLIPNYSELELDDCFTDLRADENGVSVTKITHANGEVVELWQDATFKYLMVYTHREMKKLGVDALAIALEPQTAPANALNSKTDLIWLAPGESTVARWGIRVGSK